MEQQKIMAESWGQRLRHLWLGSGLFLLLLLSAALLWRLWPFLLALPDLLYWTLLVLVLFSVAITVFPLWQRRGPRRRARPELLGQKANWGRVRQLAWQINRASEYGALRVGPRRELRRLARRLIAIRRGVPQAEARRLLQAGGWSGDERLERVLSQTEPALHFVRLARLGRRLLGRSPQDIRYQQALQHAVQSLENYSREEFTHAQSSDAQRQGSGREDR